MIIRRVEIKNFRSIRDSVLPCDDLTALVGRNGAGKSSFLQAIRVFYDISAYITEEDFFNRDANARIEIRVTYGALQESEKEEFQTYVRDDELIVTKRISFENGHISQRYYAASPQVQQFARVRAMSGRRDRTVAWNSLVDGAELPDLGAKARSSAQVEQFMRRYEANHPELMEPIEREEQFFGPRNIGGGKLDKFTKYVLVPAVREASDEVAGRQGAIYQLLDMIVLRKISARRDIRQFRSQFQERISELYRPENLTELGELGDSISQTLEKFAPGCRLNLRWDEVTLPEVPPPAAQATLIEDAFEGEISRKGHGLQRALILTLLQHLALATPAPPTEDMLSGPSGGPDLILAVEEPELYLHPARCRYMAEVLLQLVQKPEMGLGARNQVIYSTHSPYFVGLDRFDKIRMVRKVPSRDSDVPQSVVECFSLQDLRAKLAELCDAEPREFTSDSTRARAACVMNTLVNEGFFADVAVVVEGPSEQGSLWQLQEIMRKDWARLGIVVVPAGGKNSIDRPTLIFRGFSIPTYFVFDADCRHAGTKHEKGTRVCNRRYLRLAGEPQEDFPDTRVR